MLLDTYIPATYILNKIRHALLSIFVVSMLVLALTAFLGGQLPDMPLSIPTFMGTAISILLSFKLSQSYDRWWEARKIWGSIVNDSRSLVMQLLSITSADPSQVKTMAYRQIAWCYSLGQSLRGLDPLTGLDSFLSADQLAALERYSNKPLAMIHRHGLDLKEMRARQQLDAFTHMQLDSTLVRLCESQGRAERIKKTVFPVTYRMFLHFIIYVFVITLSVALKNVKWYFEVPLLVLISSAFFLLEKTATHMQDPFENRPTDTPVTAIARTVEIDLKQLLGETDVPQPYAPNKFYLS